MAIAEYKPGMTVSEITAVGKAGAARAAEQVRKRFGIENINKLQAGNSVSQPSSIDGISADEFRHMNLAGSYWSITKGWSKRFDGPRNTQQITHLGKGLAARAAEQVRQRFGEADSQVKNALSGNNSLHDKTDEERPNPFHIRITDTAAQGLKAERKYWIQRARMAGYDVSKYVETQARKSTTLSGDESFNTNGYIRTEQLSASTNGNGHENGNGYSKENFKNYQTTVSAAGEKTPTGSLR